MSVAQEVAATAVLRMPLRYGSDVCCLVSSDSRYTQDIVTLRNDPKVNRHIHHDHLTVATHERWLKGESLKRDSLNFVILVEGQFAGTASLYHIEAAKRCEFGRMVMPQDGRRIFAVAVEFLCLSLAFDVLLLEEVHCRVVEGNSSVLDFHLRNGWKRDDRYDGFTRLNGSIVREKGLSIHIEEWADAFERNRDLLARLHASRPGKFA